MGYNTKIRKTSTYGAIMIMPHACQGDKRLFAGPAGSAGSVRGRTRVDISGPRYEDVVPTDAGPSGFPSTLYSRLRGNDVRYARSLLKSLPFAPGSSAGYRLYARDHLVDRLVDGHLLADDAVHLLRPDVLVIDDRELVVL